eukprot:93406_1
MSQWTCSLCTMLNHHLLPACEICATKREQPSTSRPSKQSSTTKSSDGKQKTHQYRLKQSNLLKRKRSNPSSIKRNAVLIVNGMESQHRDKKYNDTDAAIRFNELKMQYKVLHIDMVSEIKFNFDNYWLKGKSIRSPFHKLEPSGKLYVRDTDEILMRFDVLNSHIKKALSMDTEYFQDLFCNQ